MSTQLKILEVRNFKSIKHLKLECRRVNVFIGKPNTGKSNILESIGIFSIPYGEFSSYEDLRDFVRFEDMANLFYDQDLDGEIRVTADDMYCGIKFENGQFVGSGGDNGKTIFNFDFRVDYSGSWSSSCSRTSPFKFYRFAIIDKFAKREFDFLLPPRGENLLPILLTKKAVRKIVADLFGEYRLRIVLKPQEGKIEAQKEIEDVIISYPYSLVSDTLRRIVFHLVAIETNKDSIIIFEDPEAHAFPYYAKFLAERIALDRSNQYFISTHNPYFLLSILEKTPRANVGVYITYFKDYQTMIKPLSTEELQDVLDLDASVFFNLDQFLEGE